MAKQAINWTALPNGYSDDGKSLRISLLVSPRLEPDADESLKPFPDFVDWPATLAQSHFVLTYGAGLPIDELRAVAAVATGGLAPDMTVLLDVSPEVGLGRKADDARNRFEASFDLDFHRRVRDGFLELARDEPERWRVLDAERDPDAVFADVLEAALAIL